MIPIRIWMGLFLPVYLAAAAAVFGTEAPDLPTANYKVEAAFLYNFASLTEWPANSFTNVSEPLVIAVLGKDPFGSLLEATFRGKTPDGRPVTIARFSDVREVRRCHLLFIPASEEGRLSSILSRLSSQPILTVGDSERFAGRGGIIGLVSHGDAVHFQINLKAAKKARLRLSSKLLRLAETVLPSGKEKDD